MAPVATSEVVNLTPIPAHVSQASAAPDAAEAEVPHDCVFCVEAPAVGGSTQGDFPVSSASCCIGDRVTGAVSRATLAVNVAVPEQVDEEA